MRITKTHLKKIIKEELSDMSKVEELLQDLLDQLGKLDVSIDYLASAITGDDPLSIGISQGTLGRLATPPARKQGRNVNENVNITKKSLRNLIKQVISEQNIDLGDLEDELEGKTDKELEEDMLEIAKRLVALEKKMKEMSDQYQAGIKNAEDILGQQR